MTDSTQQDYLQNMQLQGQSSSSSATSMHSSSWWGSMHNPMSTYGGGRGAGNVHDSMYTYIDEEYLHCMQTHLNWDRDNGIIHLMPIAVVHQEDLS